MFSCCELFKIYSFSILLNSNAVGIFSVDVFLFVFVFLVVIVAKKIRDNLSCFLLMCRVCSVSCVSSAAEYLAG